MVKQNQGYRKDLNLDETTIDTQALNNLAGAGIAADLRIIQNNLRNLLQILRNLKKQQPELLTLKKYVLQLQ